MNTINDIIKSDSVRTYQGLRKALRDIPLPDNRESISYITTVKVLSNGEKFIYDMDGHIVVTKLRELVKEYNKNLRAGKLIGSQVRVAVKGRLGKNSRFAYKYREGRGCSPYQTIYLKDAASADIYIYYR